MAGLPQEIIRRIVDLTPNSEDGRPHRAALSSVSDTFRSAVERTTFREFTVHHWPQTNQTEWLNLLKFIRNRPERIVSVRSLFFEIHLPYYFEEVPLVDLPGFLSTDESEFMAANYTQHGVSAAEFDRVRTPQYLLGQTLDVLRSTPRRYQSLSFFHICITQMALQAGYASPRDPVNIFEINKGLHKLAAGMDPVPSIKHIATLHNLCTGSESLVALSSNCPRWSPSFGGFQNSTSAGHCRSFTRALEHFKMPRSTMALELQLGPFNSWFPSHDLPLADMLGPAAEDPFCLALHRMIDESNLKTVTYSGPVHPSLFWPSFRKDGDDSVWPKVEHLAIRFHMHGDPSGRWYFDRPSLEGLPLEDAVDPVADPTRRARQGAGDTPIPYLAPAESVEDIDEAAVWASNVLAADFAPIHDRNKPSEKTLQPLLEAFPRLLASMPELRSAVLSMRLPPKGESALAIVYVGAGEHAAAEERIPLDEQIRDKTLPRVYLALNEWLPGCDADSNSRGHLTFQQPFSAIS
ncbi:hypothetical protein QBC34DRAFT_435425 [Podospora aff. communis PSN243]|uniref:F-box domain-containing protein n=1 Tax=Podospora aff. communis PSN243 TaxID=3040156 RepID=A0AAV9GUG4_9PEZI|nr:hypothetical protein QBC34DRAFT_435425 [Podospora aff. communis PSN243]